MEKRRVGVVVQQIKMLMCRPNDLNLPSGTYIKRVEDCLQKLFSDIVVLHNVCKC